MYIKYKRKFHLRNLYPKLYLDIKYLKLKYFTKQYNKNVINIRILNTSNDLFINKINILNNYNL